MAGRLRDPNPTTSSVSWTMQSHDDGAITVSQEEATSPASSYCLPLFASLAHNAGKRWRCSTSWDTPHRASERTVAAPLH